MSTTYSPKNITGLFRLWTLLAFISAIIIIALAMFGIHGIYSSHVINTAEKQAVLISHLLVQQQSDILFTSQGSDNFKLRIDPSDNDLLAKRLLEYLQPFDIIKIKIFAPDTTVIFSTDKAIIGEKNHDNKRLNRAFEGEFDSHLEFKDSLRDLKNETAFAVDVVETYTPIEIDGEILGVFELYVDVTKFRKDIRDGTLKSLFLLSSILFVVYIIAFNIARIGMKQVANAEIRLRNQAVTDSLTGIINRGELMSRAEEELARVHRHGPGGGNGELSLIMLDIDHFKKVNDIHGHLAGDAVLRQLPERIKQGLRIYDILGRYGGEEFLILLPNASLQSACTVAERIRLCVAEQPFTHNDIEIAATISLGVSTFHPESALTEVIELADQAMYQAKQNGRNRVEPHHVQVNHS